MADDDVLSRPAGDAAGNASAPAPDAPAAEPAGRCVFQEHWWLDAASPDGWSAVTEERDGHLLGWLPYAVYRRDGVTWCGLPPLTRLAFPVLDLPAGKYESLGRAQFHVETELIRRLPEASVHEFVLPPDHGNALAWQVLGFEARIQHTFRIDPGSSDAAMWSELNSKTRNLIRRAQDTLHPTPLDAETFAAQYRANLGAMVSPAESAAVARLAAAALARGQGRAVGVADAHGMPHAAALFVWDQRDYYYFLSTRNAGDAALGAVDLLVWLGMTDAMARGRRFDFDGVSSASRLRFLQSFGGRLAARVVVTRRRLPYEGRLLLRRMRHRLTRPGEREEFP
ncbi:MAG: GNAT family N-acetyltransferase [Vicinamibacterales bacterium]